ncbi:uncharacterized protein WCC33_004149 [Rhinophrynus dorsalis]
MTACLVSLFLGLILCTVGSWAQKEPAEPELKKPGTCPLDVSYPTCGTNPTGFVSDCKNDNDCDGKEKCCYSGCRYRCLLPLEEKVDACPYFNASICITMRPLPAQCSNDNQCQGTDRCCCFSCRHQCTPTIKVKTGQCPPIKVKCAADPPKPKFPCQQDSDCLGKKKCCDFCGKQCVDPEEEHAGVCPVSIEQKSCTILEEPLCFRDANCPVNQKCCLSDNQMRCVDALKEKTGKCPIPTAKCSFPPSNKRCNSDGDCHGDKKCCTTKCGKKCTDPSSVSRQQSDHISI